MKKNSICIITALLLFSILLCGCEQTNKVQTSQQQSQNDVPNLLTAKNFIDINLSDPEGSGAIRTLTVHYNDNGGIKSGTLDNMTRIDHKGYDDEAKEQTISNPDYDQDGVVYIIVYQEFWFPDMSMAHFEVPFWPTIYEYDLKKGFIVASAKHKDYFKTFIEASKEKLSTGKEEMSDISILALKRLIYAAEQIANGSFTPSNLYSHNYYADVYELTKNMTE